MNARESEVKANVADPGFADLRAIGGETVWLKAIDGGVLGGALEIFATDSDRSERGKSMLFTVADLNAVQRVLDVAKAAGRAEPYGERLARRLGPHGVAEAVAQLRAWEEYGRALRAAMVESKEAEAACYARPGDREKAVWGPIEAALALEVPK